MGGLGLALVSGLLTVTLWAWFARMRRDLVAARAGARAAAEALEREIRRSRHLGREVELLSAIREVSLIANDDVSFERILGEVLRIIEEVCETTSLALYLREEAALWERQALVRARPILGDARLARRFMALRRTRVFGPGLSPAERREIAHVRRRMEVELGQEGPGRTHLKFGAGGLVDVEFLVQVLQLTHGARHGTLRTPSTRIARA